MESLGNTVKKRVLKTKKNPYLHSADHLLAEELANRLSDKKHFGFYLKMATLYDHNFLRGLCGKVLEGKDVQTPGRLFAYLIKKYNAEKKISTSEESPKQL